MKLPDLLKDVDANIPKSYSATEISDVQSDSRLVKPGAIFLALKGLDRNGCDFILDAIKQGAVAILYEADQDLELKEIPKKVYVKRISNGRRVLRDLARKFYGNPSKRMKVLGITGTNGKTTITYLLEAVLKQINRSCGVIGTISYRIGDEEVIPSKNTTPGVVENQQLLKKLSDNHVDYVIMEVSSHALDQGRVDLIDFYAAIFSNLTQDHLDYHKSQEDYFIAKSKLFTGLSKESMAIINFDDAYGRRLKDMTKARVVGYGMDESINIGISQLHMNIHGSSFQAVTPWGNYSVETPLIGKHNVYNILAAVGFALGEGIDPEDIFEGINNLDVIPGRLEKINNTRGLEIFVDYAHTEDGLRNVLEGLKEVVPQKLITVFGCGGDRDRSKRPLMGKVAARFSDQVIVTTDNPRSEDPKEIARHITDGIEGNNYKVVLDRRDAICTAIDQAQKGDVIVVAGKGHEDYQIFKDKTIHFDDREVIREVLHQTCSK